MIKNNVVVKSIGHMQITAELKANWLTCWVIYVKYLYNLPGHIIHSSDFICGMCVYSYICVKYVAYMNNLWGIFVD